MAFEIPESKSVSVDLERGQIEIVHVVYGWHLDHMIKLVNSLEAETGIDPGWINNGGIFIANNKERLDEYQRLGTIAKAFGIDSHVLSPEDTKKVYPLMNVDDIYGTLYSPGDGTINPDGLCQALTRSAKRAGAKVLFTYQCSYDLILVIQHCN